MLLTHQPPYKETLNLAELRLLHIAGAFNIAFRVVSSLLSNV